MCWERPRDRYLLHGSRKPRMEDWSTQNLSPPGSQSFIPETVHIVSGLFCCVTHVSYWTCMWLDMLSYEQCFILDMHVAWHVLSWRNLTEILFIDITDAIQYTCNRLYNTDTNGESAQSWAGFPLVLSFYVKRTHTAGVSTAVICLDLMWPYYWFFVTNLYK